MADNPNIRGDGDRKRINVEQEYEVRYWTEKLGVTPEQLRAAVEAVGPIAEAVEQHIRERSGKSHSREKSVG
jgi:hypothetical protein